MCERLFRPLLKRPRGEHMQPGSDFDRFDDSFVEFSERIVLECDCGERIVLLGMEDDWSSREDDFECECGRRVNLTDRADDEVASVKRLLRRDRANTA